MMQKIKSNLLAGIATIVPLALTVYVLQVTIELTIWIGGTVAEPLERFVNVTFPGFGLLSSLVGLLIVFLALFIFGGLARNVFGKRVVKWVEDEAIRQGIEGKGAKQSINLLTVDSTSRSTRGDKWNNSVLENPSSVDIFISNGEINTRGKKGCKLRRYQIGDTPYVKIG